MDDESTTNPRDSIDTLELLKGKYALIFLLSEQNSYIS